MSLHSAIAAVVLVALSVQNLSAQTPQGGIAVVGSGEVKAKPNVLEIDMYASGSAELSGDAVVKFRDVKKRVRDAVAALKMPNLELVERSVSVTSGDSAAQMQQMMRGMPTTNTGKQRVAVGAVQQLRLRGIRDMPAEKMLDVMSRLLDTARDSGSTVGMTPEDAYMAYRTGNAMESTIVRFVLDETPELQKEAYKKAVAAAEARAKEIAELTHVKVGELISVEDVSGTPRAPAQVVYYNNARNREEPSEGRIVSDKFGEVVVSVRLNVRFAIAK